MAMSVHNTSVLLSEGPAELLERSLPEYSEILERADDLGREHLEAIDYALVHTVERLMARSPTEEELEEAYDELRGMIPIEREGEFAEWVPRWQAFADLVDARLGILEAREEGADVALRFAHGDRILNLVRAQPGLTQAEIGQRLGLKPANLSRILGVVEAHELIERRTLGREKRVHLGPRAATGPRPAEAPGKKRGLPPAYADVEAGRRYFQIDRSPSPA